MSRWNGITLSERLALWSIPEPNSGCVLWTKATRDGYGRIGVTVAANQRRTVLVHRAAYELARGPIPEGLQIDHLCRVRACINPSHMEPVTQRTNILRGEAISAKNAKKTTCPRGHPYDMVVRTRGRWGGGVERAPHTLSGLGLGASGRRDGGPYD